MKAVAYCSCCHPTLTPVIRDLRRLAVQCGLDLAAIKGVGESAVQSIVQSAEVKGNFKSLFDLAERVDSRSVNKRVYDAMIKSGGLDGLVGGIC